MEGNSDRGIDVGYLVKKTLPFNFELHTHKNRPINFLYPHEIQTNLFEQANPEKSIKSHYFSRDCAELRVFNEGSKQPSFIFLLVHLKSKLDPNGIDPQGRDRRAAELKALTEIYTEVRREQPSVPVVVGGDFNGVIHRERGEAEFLPLHETTDLQDVFSLLGRGEADAMTQIQFTRTGQTLLLQIDYLLVSQGLQPHIVSEESFVYRYKSDLGVNLGLPTHLDQRLALPSDHYPVVVTFKNFLVK